MKLLSASSALSLQGSSSSRRSKNTCPQCGDDDHSPMVSDSTLSMQHLLYSFLQGQGIRTLRLKWINHLSSVSPVTLNMNPGLLTLQTNSFNPSACCRPLLQTSGSFSRCFSWATVHYIWILFHFYSLVWLDYTDYQTA